MLQTQATTLPDGTTVLSTQLPDSQTACIGVWIDTGSRDETRPSLRGISHFLEHMLFKGTRLRTARDISAAIESRGGYLNAFTQEENTCYYAHIPVSHVWPAVDLLGDIYANATFPAGEIARERDVILEEIRMYRDQPAQSVVEHLDALLWSNHPLGRPIIGTEASVRGMTRASLLDHRRRHYCPAHTVIAMAGPVEHEECVSRISRLIQHPGKKSGRRRHPAHARTDQKRIMLTTRPIEQTHVALGFRSFGRHDPRRYALRLLNVAMGENMSSILFQRIREELGLAYAIQSQISLFDDSGALIITAGLDHMKLEQALRVMVRELDRLATRALTQRQLDEAREYALGHLSLSLEGSSAVMMWSAESYLANRRIVPLQELIDGLKRVTRDDIRQTAAQLFHQSHCSLAVLSDKEVAKQESRLRRILGGL